MPRYRQIADEFATRIASGEWPPGTLLPSYQQIADRYEVSKSTAQRVIWVLSERGLVTGEPGRGTYVREPAS